MMRMNWAEWTLWQLIRIIGSVAIAAYNLTLPIVPVVDEPTRLMNIGVNMALFWVATWLISRGIYTIGGRMKK